jgi:beta-hydroxylase
MWFGTAVIILACLAASTWVFACRGRVRFRTLREYLRKGWPIMALPNCLLYACTPREARRPVLPLDRFPGLEALCSEWPVMREEALALLHAQVFEATRDASSPAWFDLGFRTFQRRGWSKFYLHWYGVTQPSALLLCPRTVELLCSQPALRGALFAVLPAGARLTRHMDPLASSLRLHLGLSTPNDARCCIEVDGEVRVWRDGEAFIFDETYLHEACNNTEQPRIILMCDIQRPLNPLGRLLNAPLLGLLSLTIVPNLPGDHRGLVNRLFTLVAPLLRWPRRFKPRYPATYRVGKLLFNVFLVTVLLTLLNALVLATVQIVGRTAGFVV